MCKNSCKTFKKIHAKILNKPCKWGLTCAFCSCILDHITECGTKIINIHKNEYKCLQMNKYTKC